MLLHCAVTRDTRRCECRDEAGRARCLAAEAKVWDDSECRCGCRARDSDCPTGMRVDPATCRSYQYHTVIMEQH